MSSPKSEWSDRRGMFQRGKELHTPSNPTGRKFHETGAVTNAVRRSSVSSTGSGSGSPIEKTPSFPTASGRRRSSASSGLFGNLTNQKRGSQDYGQRRESLSEMQAKSGVVGSWFNSTFKGYQKPAGNEPSQDSK